MPRTKMTGTKNNSNINKISKVNLTPDEKNSINFYLIRYKSDYNEHLQQMRERKTNILEDFQKMIKLQRLNYIPDVGNKTLGELTDPKSIDHNNTYFDNSSDILSHTFEKTLSILNSTKKIHKSNLKKPKVSDEGYVTTESTRAQSTERNKQRERSTSRSSRRKSRSLSRSKMPKTLTIQLPPESATKRTPDKRMPPPASSGYGFVTPKVKPNTPLTVLRRPKQGELAISMQGSPLLVSGVITEACANVNIPLSDGRVLSLQPSNNIRMSQLPVLDDITKQQLARLRDNLNKVCEHTKSIAS